MQFNSFLVVLSTLLCSSLSRDIPENIREFYSDVRSHSQCYPCLDTGYYSSESSVNSKSQVLPPILSYPLLPAYPHQHHHLPSNKHALPAFAYCGLHVYDYHVLYIQGTNRFLTDMDVDCNGALGGPADDGRCARAQYNQSATYFQATVQGYNRSIADLDPYVHPYVVFGNFASKQGPEFPKYRNFDPRTQGIEPLSVMAVVCGDQLIYGVWGDMDGDDAPMSMVGEASLSLATACYGDSMTGFGGYHEYDVLYIAFQGADAVPGRDGAYWDAQNFQEFEASIEGLGDNLIQRIDRRKAHTR